MCSVRWGLLLRGHRAVDTLQGPRHQSRATTIPAAPVFADGALPLSYAAVPLCLPSVDADRLLNEKRRGASTSWAETPVRGRLACPLRTFEQGWRKRSGDRNQPRSMLWNRTQPERGIPEPPAYSERVRPRRRACNDAHSAAADANPVPNVAPLPYGIRCCLTCSQVSGNRRPLQSPSPAPVTVATTQGFEGSCTLPVAL